MKDRSAYLKEYRARPDVKARQREHTRNYMQKHKDDTAWLARRKAKRKARESRPEIAARIREYNRNLLSEVRKTEEYLERRRAYAKARRAIPEVAERMRQYHRNYRAQHPELKEKDRQYHSQPESKQRHNDREKIRHRSRDWKDRRNARNDNPEYKEKLRKLHSTPDWRKRRMERHNYRMEHDINYKLAVNARRRLGAAIRGSAKSGSAVRDLGCSIPQLREHLERLFSEGMTWDNWGRGGWHIDHIVPLDAFDLDDRGQFLKAVHYTNLQPLWESDNLHKSNKML